jgi:hypothetical protein
MGQRNFQQQLRHIRNKFVFSLSPTVQLPTVFPLHCLRASAVSLRQLCFLLQFLAIWHSNVAQLSELTQEQVDLLYAQNVLEHLLLNYCLLASFIISKRGPITYIPCDEVAAMAPTNAYFATARLCPQVSENGLQSTSVKLASSSNAMHFKGKLENIWSMALKSNNLQQKHTRQL